MLGVPYLVGVVVAGPRWLHLPLLVGWLAGYLWSYFALLAVKTRRIGRTRPELVVYGAVAALAGAPVVVMRPGVLVLAPAFAALLAVNAWYARRRRDRALLNGVASAVMACLMVPAAALTSGVPLTRVADAFVALLLFFAGTVLYVKTMIRERGRPTYLRASVAFHAVALVLATSLRWPLAVPFGWFLLRAAWLPRRDLTPRHVGLLEMAGSLLLVAVVVTAA
jgi:hypothetical protein